VCPSSSALRPPPFDGVVAVSYASFTQASRDSNAAMPSAQPALSGL
jgi:hypothetical protein